MDEIRVTKSMENFMFNKVVPNYIIYSKKDNYAYCTACQSEVKIPDYTKPKLEVKCPSCKAMAFLKAKGQAKKPLKESGVAVILDKYKGQVLIRYFDVHKIYNPDGTVKFYYTHECMRDMFKNDGKYEVFDRPELRDWKKRKKLVYANYWRCAGEYSLRINDRWKHISSFTGNIKQVIKETPWEYSCLDKIMKMHENNSCYDIYRNFLDLYAQCPLDEYLYKVGFNKLLIDSVFYKWLPIDKTAKTLPSILKLTKENYKILLKNGNPDYWEFIKRQRMSTYNISETEYPIWEKYFVGEYKVDRSVDLFKAHYKKNWMQFDKYVTEHKLTTKLHDYGDYLKMCDELGYDMKNTFVVFPKYFADAHQDVTERWNAIKKKKDRENAKLRNKEYEIYRDKYVEQYTFEENEFKVVVPNGCDEICAEGQNLHHCVGTYIDRVCKGLTVILFIRKLSALNRSFYTMEVRDGRMIQCRGFGNKDITPELQEFLEDFGRQKKIDMQFIA